MTSGNEQVTDPFPIEEGDPQFPAGAAERPVRRVNGGDGPPILPNSDKTAFVAALDWPVLAPLTPPDRKWAIKGWFGFGHITLLVGQGGIGKTLLDLQVASCLSLKKQFIGELDSAHRCLMWACEDDHDELWRRQLAIARWCKAGLEDFDGCLTIVPRHGLDNALVSTEYGKLLFSPRIAELAEQASDLNADVVVLDNVAQLYGGSENDRHSVTAFMNALAGALRGKAVLLLAHPSRSQGSEFSGSSAWENVARTRLYLGSTLPGEKPDPDSEPTDNVRYISRRKANYSPKDWCRMTYADGALTPDDQQLSGGIVAVAREQKAERVILDGLQKLGTMGIHGSDGSKSSHFLPRLIIEYRFNDGLPSRELTAAMRSLMVAGKLKRESVGKRQNRSAITGLVAAAAE